MTVSLAAALAERPVVLDGGLGTLLDARGLDVSSVLWSAAVLREQPDAIRRAHGDFLAAGARVIITSSYQLSADGLARGGADPRELDTLLHASLDLARIARTDSGRPAPGEGDDPVWIAASVGPYGASLADGSEYTGTYPVDEDGLRAWHRPRLAALAAAGAELFAIETIPSLDEVRALCAEADALGIPAWLSVTVADGTLRSGESIAHAAAIVEASATVFAFGINCCDPSEVLPALRLAGGATSKPLVAYPNSGEVWDASARSWHGTAGLDPSAVESWLSAGARLVGGCCRIHPEVIASIAPLIAN